MTTQIERAATTLFPLEGGCILDVKFFRSPGREVTAEQMAEQFNRSEDQIRSGQVAACQNIDGDLTD